VPVGTLLDDLEAKSQGQQRAEQQDDGREAIVGRELGERSADGLHHRQQPVARKLGHRAGRPLQGLDHEPLRGVVLNEDGQRPERRLGDAQRLHQVASLRHLDVLEIEAVNRGVAGQVAQKHPGSGTIGAGEAEHARLAHQHNDEH
jgi:hypothetical protein